MPPFALDLAYIFAGLLFVVGLKRLGSPATAREGNAMASLAMLIAIVFTLFDRAIVGYGTLAVGLIIGALLGTLLARTVRMTAMPQLVAIFNGLGGGASALVAAAELLRPGTLGVAPGSAVSAAIGILVGGVTFSGSAIAFGKLQEVLPSRPLLFPLRKIVSALLFAFLLAGVVWMGMGNTGPEVLLAIGGVSLLLGILLVIPIGGADMPVVVSLLNSYSGLAAAAAGFVLGNPLLILAGALVGAAGLILTRIMCRAMNRSLMNVAFGAFGGSDAGAVTEGGDRTVRRSTADEVALLLGYASRVAIVPGYGLAVAQAQHETRKLADLLIARGVEVVFAIHPVAGRMPGHMNVLLAEADVPYDLLLDLDDINPAMERTDVAVVVGANDVVNPDARRADSPIAGMPIVEVDRARNIVVIKRSLSPGFAGIDNPLFYLDNTMMLFADARQAMSDLAREVKEL